MQRGEEKEIIISDRVIPDNEVQNVHITKTKAALVIVYLCLAIASTILALSFITDDAALRAWATGIISSIGGAALSYGFTKGNNQ
ncbi:hypothetical protein M2341_002024 [Sphingobium sp. B7D2B]|uniref:hypothetical protein n=1 Tax=Sphingobium sp. B7D2B TaxID=2940583 RepID=UPI002225A37C|nr:hypothetical protein [Sphingobium sp. B7D2B]MCW2366577.1 hypothetical protein [Sphingobium sp. B7D2B]